VFQGRALEILDAVFFGSAGATIAAAQAPKGPAVSLAEGKIVAPGLEPQGTTG
jgi:hypothetical protein